DDRDGAGAGDRLKIEQRLLDVGSGPVVVKEIAVGGLRAEGRSTEVAFFHSNVGVGKAVQDAAGFLDPLRDHLVANEFKLRVILPDDKSHPPVSRAQIHDAAPGRELKGLQEDANLDVRSQHALE